MRSEIAQHTETMVQRYLQKYENVYKAFNKFFNDEDIYSNISTKADMKDVEAMVATRATKE